LCININCFNLTQNLTTKLDAILIFKVLKISPVFQVSVLVMCHTRELAFQISKEYERFSKYMSTIKVREKAQFCTSGARVLTFISMSAKFCLSHNFVHLLLCPSLA